MTRQPIPCGMNSPHEATKPAESRGLTKQTQKDPGRGGLPRLGIQPTTSRKRKVLRNGVTQYTDHLDRSAGSFRPLPKWKKLHFHELALRKSPGQFPLLFRTKQSIRRSKAFQGGVGENSQIGSTIQGAAQPCETLQMIFIFYRKYRGILLQCNDSSRKTTQNNTRTILHFSP